MRASSFYAGLFLVSMSVLMLQVVQTRILSVALWYYLAFFVVSLALFGLTAGAVWVYGRRGRLTAETLPRDLARYSSGLALAIALALPVQMTLAPTYARSLSFLVVWLELALVLAAPFCLAGVVVSLALTRSPFPIGRVYGVDLVGAAAGCIAAVFLLDLTSGPSAILWVAAVAGLGAWFFARSAAEAAPSRRGPFTGLLSRPGRLTLILVACALANGATRHGLQPLYVKDRIERRDDKLLHEEWNSFSRVVAIVPVIGRSLLGPAPRMPRQSEQIEFRLLTIDGQATTPMYRFAGNPEDVGLLKYDLTNLAYWLPGRRRAAIIGVGGGRDVLSAWSFGLRDVTGIERTPFSSICCSATRIFPPTPASTAWKGFVSSSLKRAVGSPAAASASTSSR